MDQTSLETTSLEGEVVENRNTITLEEADARDPEWIEGCSPVSDYGWILSESCPG